MKSRAPLVMMTGILVSFFFRLMVGLPNVTLLQGIGLPLSKHNRLLGFVYVVLSMVVYGFLYSLMHPKWGTYDPFYGIGLAVLMGLLVSSTSFFRSETKDVGYVRRVTNYALKGLAVMLVYDFFTGVVLPCAAGGNFYQAFIGQIEFSLRYSILSLVSVLCAPFVEDYITDGVSEKVGHFFRAHFYFRLR